MYYSINFHVLINNVYIRTCQLGMHRSLFNIFRYSGNIRGFIFKIRVQIDLINNWPIDCLDTRLIIGQCNLIQCLHRVHGLVQAYIFRHLSKFFFVLHKSVLFQHKISFLLLLIFVFLYFICFKRENFYFYELIEVWLL